MPQRTSAQAGSHHLHSVFLLCNFICILCARCFFLLLISINRPVNRILGPQDNMSVYFSVCFGFTRWQSAWVDLPSVHGRDSGGDETGCDEFDPRGGRGSRASGSAVCCSFYRWFVSSPGVILARAHPHSANLLDSLCQVCECLVLMGRAAWLWTRSHLSACCCTARCAGIDGNVAPSTGQCWAMNFFFKGLWSDLHACVTVS